MSRPRGYFGVGRDKFSLDGKVPPGINDGVPGVSTGKLTFDARPAHRAGGVQQRDDPGAHLAGEGQSPGDRRVLELSDLPSDDEVARINAEHLISTPLEPADLLFVFGQRRGDGRSSRRRSSSGGTACSATPS